MSDRIVVTWLVENLKIYWILHKDDLSHCILSNGGIITNDVN